MARNSKVQKKKSKPVDSKSRVRRGRAKVCMFCAERAEWVDYKDLTVLRRFINDRGRIKTRGATGACAQHQRDVAVAIKTAREMMLLPYVVRTQSPDKGDRRGGRGRSPEGVGSTLTEEGAEEIEGTDAEAETETEAEGELDGPDLDVRADGAMADEPNTV
jgi:small subunit ribosomal protein S18